MTTRSTAAVLWITGLWLSSLVCPDPASAEEKDAGSLQIEHVTEGSGPSPAATSRVKVHYHGTFEDGRVFDSSVERGKPATFPLNRVIKCWTEGLQKMKVGGKAKLTCPPAIAYGARGRPPKIPPNTTLYFEVELLAIE
jgi:FKBP-type peptidyl-prolyl cis-trans isomerase FkpA